MGWQKEPVPSEIELKCLDGEGKFFCQSSELHRITRPLSQFQKFQKALRNFYNGNYNVKEAVSLIVVPVIHKVVRSMKGIQTYGTKTITPEISLGLKTGDWVEIKPLDEILATLDKNGRNRGLQFSYLMGRYCGQKFKVRNRLDRMVLESNGSAKEVKNTVLLEGMTCSCYYVVGGCPRNEYAYWREAWLKRVEAPGEN